MSAPVEQLKATLGLRSVVLFGLAYMAPMIVLGTFGVLAADSNQTAPTAYLLALVAMLFTAISYGRMARTFPVAGSAYSYARRTIDSRVGFLVGWAILLDYFFLPMVIWLIGASYLNAQFTAIPPWLWILGFIVITTVINVLGLKLAANANLILMAVQILVLALFVVLSLRGTGSAGVFSARPFGHPGTTITAVAAGAALATYSFIGFDAITTLTEETKDARRTIPKAIVLVTVIGGALYVITSYAAQLVANTITVRNVDNEAFQIALRIGGNLFSAVFLAGLIVTQFASGIAAQASAARLLYAMGRDNVLPRKVFGYLHPRFSTPVVNIVAIGAVGLIGISLSISTSTGFINFGAFTAFTFVNLAVLAHAIRRREVRTPKQWLINIAVPVFGAAIDVVLMTQLDVHALTIGPIWLGLGVIYLLVLTRGFSRPPPEVDFAAAE
ncbi:MAG: APC family permease [Sciscionella sp.]